jgi:ATPase subunit of ABC transporter with duplicated ATPase domains
MDLISTQCLEAALADFPGALLLVSHDLRFLDALITTRWKIRKRGAEQSQLFTL